MSCRTNPTKEAIRNSETSDEKRLTGKQYRDDLVIQEVCADCRRHL